MEKDRLEKAIVILCKQMLNVEQELVAQRAAVTVLRCCLAKELNPDDPLKFLEELREAAQRLVDTDPNTQRRQEASEIFDLLKDHDPKLHDPDA